MSTQLFTLVDQTKEKPKVEHYQGLPPELTNEQDHHERLPWPRVLIIEERPDGVFLFRFATDGRFGGDTWHTSINEAKDQADYEYGDALEEWKQVPSEVTDIVGFALAQAS